MPRLSRPFIEPIYDFSDAPPLPGEASDDESTGLPPVELAEKFLVIVEEDDEEGEGDEDPKSEADLDNSRSVSSAVVDAFPPSSEPPTTPQTDLPPSDFPSNASASSATETDLPPSDAPASPTTQTDLPSSDAPMSPPPVSEKTAAASSDSSPASPEQPDRTLSRLISLATAKVAMQDHATLDQFPLPTPNPEPQAVVRPLSTPTIAIDFAPSPPLEAQSPVGSTTAFASTEEGVNSEQDGGFDEEHGQHDEEDDDQLSSPPSPTLSQAEEDLMATLALDPIQKFIRPNSWLADSPTLGNAALSPVRDEEIRPATALGTAVLPSLREEEARPATALGNEIKVEDVGRKKKVESHYAFLWSPDNGWYVV